MRQIFGIKFKQKIKLYIDLNGLLASFCWGNFFQFQLRKSVFSPIKVSYFDVVPVGRLTEWNKVYFRKIIFSVSRGDFGLIAGVSVHLWKKRFIFKVSLPAPARQDWIDECQKCRRDELHLKEVSSG